MAARHGLEGEWRSPKATRVPTSSWQSASSSESRDAQDMGSTDDLDCVEDILRERKRRLTPAGRPTEANHDLREVMAEIATRRRSEQVTSLAVSQPDLFVVWKNCGSEVSPVRHRRPVRLRQRVRKRAP